MKTFERILLKAAVIQFIILLLTQVFFHRLNALPELKEITQYEGVSENNFSEILETIGNTR
ncbi:YpfB family protein [Mesobacillus harenae]|uniref:YpfB family protein n=1 Tax=Mesobacillus harenae TaxID=2213203 RepID=UPI001580EB07|nr:YpfB family protein [Mesobacillus harenae]